MTGPTMQNCPEHGEYRNVNGCPDCAPQLMSSCRDHGEYRSTRRTSSEPGGCPACGPRTNTKIRTKNIGGEASAEWTVPDRVRAHLFDTMDRMRNYSRCVRDARSFEEFGSGLHVPEDLDPREEYRTVSDSLIIEAQQLIAMAVDLRNHADPQLDPIDVTTWFRYDRSDVRWKRTDELQPGDVVRYPPENEARPVLRVIPGAGSMPGGSRIVWDTPWGTTEPWGDFRRDGLWMCPDAPMVQGVPKDWGDEEVNNE